MDTERLKITTYERGVSDLPDYPSDEGYTASQLKAMFDARSNNEIKERHNALVDELLLVAEDVAGKAEKKTAGGGFSGGENADAVTGGAVGKNARSTYGGAVGEGATSGPGGAIGKGSAASFGGAVGYSAVAGRGFSGGLNAQVVNQSSGYIDAIQLGSGTNDKAMTLKVYDRTVVDFDETEENSDKWYLSDVGKLKALNTEAKDSIVSAINEVASNLGDIDSALDGILALQASYIGGGSE